MDSASQAMQRMSGPLQGLRLRSMKGPAEMGGPTNQRMQRISRAARSDARTLRSLSEDALASLAQAGGGASGSSGGLTGGGSDDAPSMVPQPEAAVGTLSGEAEAPKGGPVGGRAWSEAAPPAYRILVRDYFRRLADPQAETLE
jgi:hypothetical protein